MGYSSYISSTLAYSPFGKLVIDTIQFYAISGLGIWEISMSPAICYDKFLGDES